MSETRDLQFEKAEPVQGEAPTQVKCGGCGAQLSTYYDVNGKVACEDCKDKVLVQHRASHLPALFRAGALGAVAAAVGAGIYYAIAAGTGYEFGLMSIVLGLMVGFAVRRGARGRGGWRYQALAMFLCYAAISATYVPRVISALHAKEEAKKASADKDAAAKPAAPEKAAREEPVTFGLFLKSLGILFVFALALPFLAGFDNIMGLVIIAIGLYEAWKVNKAAPFSVSGPFEVGVARTAVG
jgi:DNA-directed RNA polymerase subunit RPC12/RpoP